MSISSFIRYKRSVIKRSTGLLTIPNLISIDGMNGSGKDSLAISLRDVLARTYGSDNVVIADITHFVGPVRQRRLGQVLKARTCLVGSGFDDLKDNIFAAALNRGYDEVVIPLLQRGAIVIMPRSELSLLQFVLLKGDGRFATRRFDSIVDGTITHGLCAGHRVFMDVTVSDQWQNLTARGELGVFDPRSIEECEAEFQSESAMRAKAIPSLACSGSRVIHVPNARVREDFLPEHFAVLAQRLSERIDLSDVRPLA
jgi:thymidylate kinase